MIYFAVVTGAAAAVERVAPKLPGALQRSRLFNGERIERRGASGTWAAAAIATPDPTCPMRLAADDDAFAVVNGPALASDANQADLAADLLRTFRLFGSEGVAAHLGGTYNFVGVAPNRGLRAFGDFSGVYPIYWYEGTDYTLVSNRSLAIADAVGAAGWDRDALAWIGARSNLVGEHVPARGVRYVPPGHEARVAWGDNRVRIERGATWIWAEPSDDLGRENLTASEWDDVTDALVTHVRALGSLEGPLRLSITGGKDSRLCLALAKAAGLRDHITTYTNGGPDNPETQVGRAVAEAAQFAHDDKRAPTGPAKPLAERTTPRPSEVKSNADRMWSRFRLNITRYEGIVCAWSALANPTNPPFLNIKGFGGELYRRGHDKRFRNNDVPSVDDLAAQFVKGHRAVDLLGIVRPDVAKRQAQWLTDWVHHNAGHVRLDQLPEKFYVDFRLGHWSGPNLQCAPNRVNINPLALASAARKNLELSPAARTAERFHFEVMVRAAPELVMIPFLADTWAPEIRATSTLELPSAPYETVQNPTERALNPNPGWPFLESEGAAIARVFKDADKHTDMRMFFDTEKLQALSQPDEPIAKTGAVREMVNAIGIALTLLDRAEPVVVDASVAAPKAWRDRLLRRH